MTLAELELALQTHCGWDLRTFGRDSLAQAILRRAHQLKLKDADEYLQYLSNQPPELALLVEEVTISESWFYREIAGLTAAGKHLASLHSNAPSRLLRILSAPCSRGEEPVSLAIFLLESKIPSKLVKIDALELSELALARARSGFYSNYSFRAFSPELRDRYFQRQPSCSATRALGLEGEVWKLDPSVAELICYQRRNLTRDLPLHGGPYLVVFCRNFLIYLHAEARTRLLHSLADCMAMDAILIPGSAEFSIPPDTLFEFQRSPGSGVFSRRKNKPSTVVPPTARATAERGLVDPQLGPRAARSLVKEAETLANRGEHDLARERCLEAIRKEPTGQAYFILARVCQDQNQTDEAERNLRRALYLQPDHSEALLQLAEFRERVGDRTEAERLRIRRQRVVP